MTDFETFESILKTIIAETGELHLLGGGVEIKVLDPVLFPWAKVMTTLTNIPQNIWITKENDLLVIKTKPPSV